MKLKCPSCGRFCKLIRAIIKMDNEIVSVSGVCKKHGKVDLTRADWSWDDFFFGGEA